MHRQAVMNEASKPFKKILCATDFSDDARRAFRAALDLAQGVGMIGEFEKNDYARRLFRRPRSGRRKCARYAAQTRAAANQSAEASVRAWKNHEGLRSAR